MVPRVSLTLYWRVLSVRLTKKQPQSTYLAIPLVALMGLEPSIAMSMLNHSGITILFSHLIQSFLSSRLSSIRSSRDFPSSLLAPGVAVKNLIHLKFHHNRHEKCAQLFYF